MQALRDGSIFRTAVGFVDTPGRPRTVGRLVLKANGSVAWIVDRAAFMGSPRSIDVVAEDATGRRVLDSGVDIDAGSLTLNGSTLTWQKDGATQSGTLN